MSDDGEPEVSPAERAHQRRRDRKRETRMVVDNAAIRRLLPAMRRRSQAERPAGDDAGRGDAGRDTPSGDRKDPPGAPREG